MIIGYWVSHYEAPLTVREKISLANDQQQAFAQHVAAQGAEAIVLSTCNRTEMYVNVQAEAHAANLWQHLLSLRGMAPVDVAEFTIYAVGLVAAEHLFRVSSGLESVIIGEPQILGQVTNAHELAKEQGAVAHTLSLLCRSAIHTAKRVRTETEIAKGAMSFSSLGIRRVESNLGSIKELPVLVIGAGEMGQSVVKTLSLRGAQDVTLVSRTRSRAELVAKQWGIRTAVIAELPGLLAKSQVVFSTSSAPIAILTPDLVEPAATKSMVLVDLALPRDIHPAVEALPHVSVYDLETLTHQLEDSVAQRERAIPIAEALIAEEIKRYWVNHQTRAVVPTIKDIRSQADEIRRAELERLSNRISDEQAALLEEFSHRLMNKLLHHPTVALRTQAAQDNGDIYADVARELFGLAEPQAEAQ